VTQLSEKIVLSFLGFLGRDMKERKRDQIRMVHSMGYFVYLKEKKALES